MVMDASPWLRDMVQRWAIPPRGRRWCAYTLSGLLDLQPHLGTKEELMAMDGPALNTILEDAALSLRLEHDRETRDARRLVARQNPP